MAGLGPEPVSHGSSPSLPLPSVGTVGQWDWLAIKRVLRFRLCVAPLSLTPLCGNGCGLGRGGQRGAYSPSAAPDVLPLSQEGGWRERGK